MTREQMLVAEFHHAFGLTVAAHLDIGVSEIRDLRVRLIMEETREVIEALDHARLVEFHQSPAAKENALSSIAQELADLLYVTYGTAVSLGIDLEPVFNEVHRANMTKLRPDGTVERRADGKILKPSTYEPPNIVRVLAHQFPGGVA